MICITRAFEIFYHEIEKKGFKANEKEIEILSKYERSSQNLINI